MLGSKTNIQGKTQSENFSLKDLKRYMYHNVFCFLFNLHFTVWPVGKVPQTALSTSGGVLSWAQDKAVTCAPGATTHIDFWYLHNTYTSVHLNTCTIYLDHFYYAFLLLSRYLMKQRRQFSFSYIILYWATLGTQGSEVYTL